MLITYQPQGVCSQQMKIEVEEGIVKSLQVMGGCHGNLQGISKLVEGMKVEDVIQRLEGIRCGGKPTSCPDQLAKALKEAEGSEYKKGRPYETVGPPFFVFLYLLRPR